MNLSEFFHALNLYNITIFIFCFLIFDAIGFKIAKYLKTPGFLRLTNWIWGLGIFIFIWFLLHAFIPFHQNYVIFSLIILAILFIPSYIKQGGIIDLGKTMLKFLLPFLLLILVFKPLSFLLSAPPWYADEMNYQFYSPARIFLENHWPFLDFSSNSSPGLYEMIPKFLNTGYWLMFSLTKTYATARLLHFLIVFSAIYAIASFFKTKFNTVSAVFYATATFLFSPHFFLYSTLGYVDAAAAIFSILFLISVANFLQERRVGNLYACAIIFGLTIGMKYTILAFLGSVTVTGILIYIFINRKKLTGLFNISHFLTSIKIGLLISLFGGYWYIKNLIISGNPIYPFVFKCFHNWSCATSYDYFAGWAIPLDLPHFENIKMALFQESNFMFYITLITLLFTTLYAIHFKIRKLLFIIILIISALLIEITISSKISGFELRYFYHWLLLIPLALTLPFGLLFVKNIKPRKEFTALLLLVLTLVISSSGINTYKSIKRLYEGDYVPGYIRNYTRSRISLNQWINYYYPQMSEYIKWCGKERKMQDILIIDPQLIWFSSEGYSRAFLVNCNILSPFSSDLSVDELAKSIPEKYPHALIASLEKCSPDKKVSYSISNPVFNKRHDLNQKMICKSKETVKNLYSYQK